jgi:tetratricopeptide (TPR) repeat protein
MNWRMLQQQPDRADPRAAVTWLGAAVVLGCGLWLAGHGGPLALGPRAHPAATDMEEVGWIDQRLVNEQASGVIDDSQRECRLASLHWDRATRLAQNEYYRRFGMAWTGDHEEEFGSFRRQYLKKDGSKDVAAARAAAIRALALLPAGPDRVRPLWFLCLASSSEGHWNEAIGALIEISRYKPKQPWVWRLLAQAYQSCGDAGRQDLAEEQAWRASTDRPMSAYITAVVRHTPYARLPARAGG